MANIPQLTALELLLNEAEYQRLLVYGKQFVESAGDATSATPLAQRDKTAEGEAKANEFRQSDLAADAALEPSSEAGTICWSGLEKGAWARSGWPSKWSRSGGVLR